jgi:hypothetical protein
LICGLCHAESQVASDSMAEMHCTSCHEYLVEKEKLLPLREGCLDCHQALTELGVTWGANAPMQFPCGDCHQPHERQTTLVQCESCHEVKGLHIEGAHGAADCQTCHQPHEWEVEQREACLTCHPAQVEHHPGTICGTCHSFH